MNNIYRIIGSVFVEEDKFHKEFNTVMIGNDIRRIVSSYLDKFPEAEILEVIRLNYAEEEVFNDV